MKGTKALLNRVVETAMADSATDLPENPRGMGRFYARGGAELTAAEAKDMLLTGRTVEVPNAGASTFRSFFDAVGFSNIDVFEWSSSAGDWSFAVCDGDVWYPAFQSNRYPRHGFEYSVRWDLPCQNKKTCFGVMEAGG